MIILTSEEMRFADKTAIEEYGYPPVLLMEYAALGAAKIIASEYPEARKILILCGKGNNGGDGLALARILKNKGLEPEIFLLFGEDRLSELASLNLSILRKTSSASVFTSDYWSKDIFKKTDLIVDAIFGVGFSGTIAPEISEIIESVNNSKKPVLSIDIPSGLNADTGKVSGVCVKADKTAAIGFPKRGFFLYPGFELTGDLFVVDIGLPENTESQCSFADASLLQSWIPRRKKNDWKGSAGRLFVLAGSEEYTGAAALLCKAAMRSGCGMTYLAVPEEISPIMHAKLTETVIVPYSENDYSRLFDFIDKSDAAAVGPGLGNSEFIKNLVKMVMSRLRIPVVADADALYPDLLSECSSDNLVITPHIGEAARLIDKTVQDIKLDMMRSAFEAASLFGSVAVLKGPNSIIALPDDYFYFNLTGSESMATAGSGDVLTGVVGSLLARGCSSEESAVLGCFIHGAAGDAVAKERGRLGITASDILERIPEILESLFSGSSEAIEATLKIRRISVV